MKLLQVTALFLCLFLAGKGATATSDNCKLQESPAVNCENQAGFSDGNVVSIIAPCKTNEYGAANCETEMAHLDNYAIEAHVKSKAVAYIVIYGGRRDTARREARGRLSRIKRYLIKERGIEPERIAIVDGGFREKLVVELWLVPQGETLPKPTPTIARKDVKYRKGGFDDCSIFY